MLKHLVETLLTAQGEQLSDVLENVKSIQKEGYIDGETSGGVLGLLLVAALNAERDQDEIGNIALEALRKAL